jgi:hypothetical protein
MNLPWNQLEVELGTIHALDTGCGAGNYGPRFQSFSGSRLATYKGVDSKTHSNWKILEDKNTFLSFSANDSKNVHSEIPDDTNLFLSQSAIEHFEEDLTYFRGIRKFILEKRRATVQIHVFPSSICLRLYRNHGIRQYTPRTVSMIVNLFSPFSKAKLFNLGGQKSNSLHWEFITKPLYVDMLDDRRDSHSAEYYEHLKKAITSDIQYPNDNEPSFYALVIHSFPKTNVSFG